MFRRAAERPCALELNAQPARLDLDEALVRAAAEAGVLISIATDAHGTEELALLEDGVVQARRGWLGPAQVLNARPLPGLRTFLAATRRS